MMQAVTWPDVIIAVVFLLSIVIAIFRGFVREFISIATWIAAVWLGIVFADTVAVWLPAVLDEAGFSIGETQIDVHNLRIGIAFVLIAVVVLITGAVINYVLGILMKAQVLKGADRFLGALFGAVRAAVIIVALVMISFLTSLPQTASWSASSFLPPFESIAVRVVQNLPGKYAQYFNMAGGGSVADDL